MATVSDSPPADAFSGRRRFFKWLTYGLGAVAAAAAGIPFVGYLFGASKAPVKWVPLGPVTDFPMNQTRLVNFDNPIRQPWDGMVARTGVYVRYEGVAWLFCREWRRWRESREHNSMTNHEPGRKIGHRVFADGVAREVFEDRDGRQYVLSDTDEGVYGQRLARPS